MKRITAFVGAGAALEIGGPLTSEITKRVRKKKQQFFGKETYLIDRVGSMLDRYYKQPCDFEEIFHALELIGSYRTGWNGAIKKYTPYLSPFVKPRHSRFFKDDLMLSIAQRNIIETVADMVAQYDDSYQKKNENDWHFNFWKKLNETCPLDIATLNYDTCIENSIGRYEDGFESTAHSFHRFQPKRLLSSSQSKILHLHGCINYGYGRPANINEYTLEDDFEDVYKFHSHTAARETWSGRSTNSSQASEQATIGPIITGLKKTDKAITLPYSFYNNEFQRAVVNNKALLVVGYSFGDLHFNNVLERMARIHGTNRRIVLITKFTGYPGVWHRNWQSMKWPERREMFTFICKAFGESQPFTGREQHWPLVSKNGLAKIYLNGFKDAVENNGNEILDFLTS